MDSIAGTTAASLDALCAQYVSYWRQARLEPGAARQSSLQSNQPDLLHDQQMDGASADGGLKQTIKIADLDDFIKKIEQQLKAIKELEDQVNCCKPIDN